MRQTSTMLVSNKPRVLGRVIITPARFGPATSRRASRSTLPSLSDASSTTLKPAMAAEAGLVPWALSGIATVVRSLSSLARWWARIMSIPPNSPCAPARVDNPTSGRPVISPKNPCSLYSNSSAPCDCSEGCIGCMPAKPGRNAISSLILGLYFIVQLPKG